MFLYRCMHCFWLTGILTCSFSFAKRRPIIPHMLTFVVSRIENDKCKTIAIPRQKTFASKEPLDGCGARRNDWAVGFRSFFSLVGNTSLHLYWYGGQTKGDSNYDRDSFSIRYSTSQASCIWHLSHRCQTSQSSHRELIVSFAIHTFGLQTIPVITNALHRLSVFLLA